MRVGDQRRGLHSPPSSGVGVDARGVGGGDRALEVIELGPFAAAPDEGLPVPLRSRQPGRGDAADRQPRLARGQRHLQHRLLAVGGVADDAAADPFPSQLELRLHHRQHFAAGHQAGGDRGQDLGQGDEGDVDGRQRGEERQVGGAERAGVQALDHDHPGVLAQAGVDLAVGDVDRGDPGRAPLQHAVGEAAGRGADVEAVAVGDVDPQRLERVVQLDPAAGDEPRLAPPARSRPPARPAGSAAGRPARRSRPALRPPGRRRRRPIAREKGPARRELRRSGPSSCPKASARPPPDPRKTAVCNDRRPCSRLFNAFAQDLPGSWYTRRASYFASQSQIWRHSREFAPETELSVTPLTDNQHIRSYACSRIQSEQPIGRETQNFLVESRVVHMALDASHIWRPRLNWAHLPPTDPHI